MSLYSTIIAIMIEFNRHCICKVIYLFIFFGLFNYIARKDSSYMQSNIVHCGFVKALYDIQHLKIRHFTKYNTF